ncbi:hypothetical protein [Actinomadura decatromicini]|uniref:Uncharacterized protein n=1 Tax=Actinomadura decatromicini TaxID=2604572 RepID=A0A5D3FA75_9ACTN|nr:hypothetical protein [Actinomadura decatromicini]TYK45103.1 hypothetical protein FXF68_30950 [Actinomadura decatromicini]
MDTSDLIALAALVVAAAGFGVSVWAIVYSRRSAAASRDSADEARRLREIESDRRTDEKQRRHEELAPELPPEIEAVVGGAWQLGMGALYGTIRVRRSYRVRAYGRAGESLTPLSLPSIVPAGEPLQFVIEPWTSALRTGGEPSIKEILFKFWPPVEGVDHGEVWSCGCGRPGGETMEGPAHWERRVRVILDTED